MHQAVALLVGWLLPLGLAAAAAPSAATGLSAPADVAATMRLLDRLSDPQQAEETLEALSTLLNRCGAALPEAQVSSLREKLGRLEVEPIAGRRASLRAAIDAQTAELAGAVRDRLPPVVACDVPNDDGSELHVYWRPRGDAASVRIERRSPERPAGWTVHAQAPAAGGSFLDNRLVRPWRTYQYRLTFLSADKTPLETLETNAIVARGSFLNTNRLGLLAFLLVLGGTVVFCIGLARRGVKLRVRRIAGLDAVEEAVGRATEMGRPVLFVCGTQDINDIQTVAGLTVLSRVARVAAEHDADLEVPTNRSLVMTAARETVQAAYLDAGRPDAYDERRVYYTTDEQFGFVSALSGILVRTRPATCFYLGAFFAESLILAETANAIGSIQIAGTAMPAQLPFFVAACDYTLIGEELFAASAYLSGEPQQLGSLKGQDLGKLLGIALILVGAALATGARLSGDPHGPWARGLRFLQGTLLESADH